MTPEGEFLAAYEIGELVFFAGAGASFNSEAAKPADVLAASADLFLPSEPALAAQVADVKSGAGVPGTFLRGIQPEIFYEHLLNLRENRDLLALWKVLSPEWLKAQRERLLPNANHLAIARYAARTGIPVFTTNFDTLFEDAATALGLICDVVIGDSAQLGPSKVLGTPGRMLLYKLHGTISMDGKERLDTLATTMEGITTVNGPMIDLITRVSRMRALTFVGYSACDIDYFPVVAAVQLDRRPFWFVPPGDLVTDAHAKRLHARQIERYPSSVFAGLMPEFPENVPGPNASHLLQQLKSEVSVTLREDQKRLLLALCLQSMGRNSAAGEVLGRMLQRDSTLGERDRALALLLQARVQDCLSEYRRSAASAEAALTLVREAGGRLDAGEATEIRVRALYLRSMARQQQIGPGISYGDRRLDWRPSPADMVRQLLEGLWVAGQFAWLDRKFRKRQRRTLGQTRAEHAMNDHSMMLLGRVISLFEAVRLARSPVVGDLLRSAINRLRARALATGDYFVYAGSQKYFPRVRGDVGDDLAGETYGLLRDPLNYAVVRRDTGVRFLREGKRALASAEFRAAAESARACGSRATELKALVGLAVCDAATAGELQNLGAICSEIEGTGYERFCSERVAPFLRAGVQSAISSFDSNAPPPSPTSTPYASA